MSEPLNIDDRELNEKAASWDRFLRHLSEAGKKGGSSRSERKKAAGRRNMARARKRRWDPHAPLDPPTAAIPTQDVPYYADTPLPDYTRDIDE